MERFLHITRNFYPVKTIGVLIVLLTQFSGAAFGQESRINLASTDFFVKPVIEQNHLIYFAPPEVHEKDKSLLNKIISIDLVDVPMDESLQRIAEMGNIRVAFSRGIAKEHWKKPVSLQFEEATVLGALYAALNGTGLRLVLSHPADRGHLVVVNGEDSDGEEAAAKSKASIQYGSIAGIITDESTGETLPGASIFIEGTTHGTTTDMDGRYVLRRVPEGVHTLVFQYMGFETKEVDVSVVENERVMLDVNLEDIAIRGDDIVISASQRGQARSLTRQRESVNIRNIISSEQIDAFAVQDVSSALSRVVGMGHGGANIRGVGAGASNITMDGQRMGSTGQDRSVDLSTISVDMVEELDVIKVITPDMDADAMSGVINVSTRRPIGGDRSMNIRLGGGMQDRYFRHSGSQARVSLSYGDSPKEHFTYGVNFSYQRDPHAREMAVMNWEGLTFDEGRVEVLSNFRTELRWDVRDRYAAGVQMTFQPTQRSTYYVQSMFNYQEREITQHGLRYSFPLELYTDPNRTGLEDAKSNRIDYQPQLDQPTTHQYTTQLRVRHLLDRFDVEYVLGWGHGRNNEDSYTLQLRTREMGELTAEPKKESIFMSARHDQGIDHRISRHLDNEFIGRLDFEAPYSRGKIKFGTSALFTFKNGRGERFQNTYDKRLQAGDFHLIPNAEWRIMEREHDMYVIPWMVDMKKVKELYFGQRPHFAPDLDLWAMEVGTSIYGVEEHTIGAYVMGSINISRVKILGGIRLENSMNNYEGRVGAISDEGRFLGATDVRSSSRYLNYFPNAQMVYSLSRMTKVRVAYSRSIGRPRFNQLSPNILRNYRNETIRQGNPDLNPMLSHNLDFILDHYFMTVGTISAGFFYKNLSDFIFSHSERIRATTGDNGETENGDEPPVYEGWMMTTFLNGREAHVYGVELSWQQNLSFLPGFLGNLGTYVNYAYTQSLADIGRRHPDPAISDTISVPLIDQRPYVLNAGLSYTQGRFHGQVSYHWSAPSISSYGPQQWVPQIHQRHREYFDAYRDAENDMSLTVRYRISTNFRIWADASNILNNKSRDYFFDRDFYPRQERLSGRRINMGLRYTF